MLKVKMITGSISSFIRRISEFISDGSVFFSKEGHIFFQGKHYAGIRDVEYNELKELVNTNKLIPGAKYRITDYRTIYSHKEFDGQNYVTYGIEGSPVVCPVEPLIVTAISNNKLDIKAQSEQYPFDVIHYTIDTVNGYNRNEDNHKGTIIYRLDTINNNSVTEDWRNIQYPVFQFDKNIQNSKPYNSTGQYKVGDIVLFNDKIYLSRIDKSNSNPISDKEFKLCFIEVDFDNLEEKVYTTRKRFPFYIHNVKYDNYTNNKDSILFKYFAKNSISENYQNSNQKIVYLDNSFIKYDKTEFNNKKNNIISSYKEGLTLSVVKIKDNNNNINTIKSYIIAYDNNILNSFSCFIVSYKSTLNYSANSFCHLNKSEINSITSSFVKSLQSLIQFIDVSFVGFFLSNCNNVKYVYMDKNSGVNMSNQRAIEDVILNNTTVYSSTGDISILGALNSLITFNNPTSKKIFINYDGEFDSGEQMAFEDYSMIISNKKQKKYKRLRIFDNGNGIGLSYQNQNGNYELIENTSEFYNKDNLNSFD